VNLWFQGANRSLVRRTVSPRATEKRSTSGGSSDRVTLDQGPIYPADRGTNLLICKTVSLGMSAPVMAFGRCRSLSRTGFL